MSREPVSCIKGIGGAFLLDDGFQITCSVTRFYFCSCTKRAVLKMRIWVDTGHMDSS